MMLFNKAQLQQALTLPSVRMSEPDNLGEV
jgi:hypothetical protein